MKPSLTPCSFSKRSLYLLRNSITGCMLTSLNVVRIAAVDCDATRRSATRWRNRDIGTRCSGLCPSAAGSGTTGAGGALAIGGGAVGDGAGAAGDGAGDARFSTAASTSPLVMRPPRPVPSTADAPKPCSAIILRADGKAVVAAALGGAFAGATAPAPGD